MSTETNYSGKRIAFYFVAFFVVLTVVYTLMATLAIRSQTGLVTDHPYEKGLAYNEVVKDADEQAALGWQGEITYNGKQLIFTLKDKAGRPLKLEKASAQITRPTQAGLDFSVELKDGAAEVTFPEKGLWEVRVFAKSKGKDYQQARRIVVE